MLSLHDVSPEGKILFILVGGPGQELKAQEVFIPAWFPCTVHVSLLAKAPVPCTSSIDVSLARKIEIHEKHFLTISKTPS
jgi:hypothetical protein